MKGDIEQPCLSPLEASKKSDGESLINTAKESDDKHPIIQLTVIKFIPIWSSNLKKNHFTLSHPLHKSIFILAAGIFVLTVCMPSCAIPSPNSIMNLSIVEESFDINLERYY